MSKRECLWGQRVIEHLTLELREATTSQAMVFRVRLPASL